MKSIGQASPGRSRAFGLAASGVFLVVLASEGQGGAVHLVEVRHADRAYQVHIETVINAAPRVVLGLLTDYAHLTRISPAVKESEVVAAFHGRRHRVRTVVELCVWIFCRALDQVQDMQQKSDRELVATLIPEGSDFKAGWARWIFRQEGGATRVSFTSQMEPDFLVPPLIGPWLLRRMLQREAVNTIEGLERLAPGLDRP